jgi:ferritin-like metal-binding protein YciE
MEPAAFEEVTQQFGMAFRDHSEAEAKYTRLLRYLQRTNGLEPLNAAFQQYLDELEAEVERTRGIYEERLNDLIEAIRMRRSRSLH